MCSYTTSSDTSHANYAMLVLVQSDGFSFVTRADKKRMELLLQLAAPRDCDFIAFAPRPNFLLENTPARPFR